MKRTLVARPAGTGVVDGADLVPPPRRLPLVVFGLFLLTLVVLGVLAARSMRVEARRRGAAELDSIAALKLEELRLWRRSAIDDTAFAASYPFVHTASLRVAQSAMMVA